MNMMFTVTFATNRTRARACHHRLDRRGVSGLCFRSRTSCLPLGGTERRRRQNLVSRDPGTALTGLPEEVILAADKSAWRPPA